jgi:hypothetical protein
MVLIGGLETDLPHVIAVGHPDGLADPAGGADHRMVCRKVLGCQMNEFPPGSFISMAIKTLPPAGPDLPPQTVEIDARPGWGLYRVTFVVSQNPRQGMRSWFWVMDKGERISVPYVAARSPWVGLFYLRAAQCMIFVGFRQEERHCG